MKKKLSGIAFGFAALLLLTCAASSTRADGITFLGQAPIQPAGFGTQNYILAIQAKGNSGTETGGVKYTPGGDVAFGDAKTGASQTGTVGVTQASNLRLYFNINEPNALGKTDVTINSLTLTAYDQKGNSVFSASLIGGPLTLQEIGNGQGTSDYVFGLDAAAAARLQAAIDANPNLRIGLSASISNAQGGPESFFVRGGTTSSAPVPEPATMLLFGTGLAGVASRIRKRRNVAKEQEHI